MNPVLIAIKGKGIPNALKRLFSIVNRYGFTSKKMDLALANYGNILAQYNAGASFPITATVLARNKGLIEKHQAPNIEFAVHGFHHFDDSKLPPAQQISDYSKARQMFGEIGIISSGFRSPYLQYHEETIKAISETGFIYDSSSSLSWDVLDDVEPECYQQGITFYHALSANDYPSLPRIENNIVEIPYSLPDDESLIERLNFNCLEELVQPWLRILNATYATGELFTLGLHPERINQCETPLKAVLETAREQFPRVWIARLDEIAQWWLHRSNVKPVVLSPNPGEYFVKVNRIQGLTILGRNVEIISPSKDWDGTYRIAQGNTVQLRSEVRPFIGISPNSNKELSSFLQQQGYIVETVQSNLIHSIFLDHPNFSREDEKPLLSEIENNEKPLLRFGRWPNEAKSALSITGDIDALTIWDYFMRVWRK